MNCDQMVIYDAWYCPHCKSEPFKNSRNCKHLDFNEIKIYVFQTGDKKTKRSEGWCDHCISEISTTCDAQIDMKGDFHFNRPDGSVLIIRNHRKKK